MFAGSSIDSSIVDAIFLTAAVIIFFAAVIQKMTGMGFALVATPVLVLLYGPTTGVLIIITLGVLLSLIMIVTAIKLVAWKPTLLLIAGGILTAPIAAFVATHAEAKTLLIIVGGAAILALTMPHLIRSRGSSQSILAGTPGALIFGAMAGFLHVSSGLSGPPLAAYSTKSKWDHKSFVASIQVFFIVFSGVTLTLRGAAKLPGFEIVWLALIAIIGLLTGVMLNRFVPIKIVRFLMFTVAWAGAFTVLFRGLFT